MKAIAILSGIQTLITGLFLFYTIYFLTANSVFIVANYSRETGQVKALMLDPASRKVINNGNKKSSSLCH